MATKRTAAADAPAAPDIPATVRVWEGAHNGVGRVVGANEDGARLDIQVDLHGLGREVVLTGVHRRQGNGNGWEPI